MSTFIYFLVYYLVFGIPSLMRVVLPAFYAVTGTDLTPQMQYAVCHVALLAVQSAYWLVATAFLASWAWREGIKLITRITTECLRAASERRALALAARGEQQ